MKPRETFTRESVLKIIECLLQMPDVLIDAVQNEETNSNAETLLTIAENEMFSK